MSNIIVDALCVLLKSSLLPDNPDRILIEVLISGDDSQIISYTL
ncbi:hypothetical protein [Desertivirga xinjiangensis]|nr:hypothetical protein [Pedobacter xinjiangensis]